MKRIFVSGCFDMLHGGHLGFLRAAAALGELAVAIGSDVTIAGIKGRPPIIGQADRLAIVAALKCVSGAFISAGAGTLDFAAEIERDKPDMLVVGPDGDAAAKRDLCRRLGIEYRVIRGPFANGRFGPIGSGDLRAGLGIPCRLDLGGEWLDQPAVNKLCPGPVIVASLWPEDYHEPHSGLATSTQKVARRLWGDRLPAGEPEETARLLFGAENPPSMKDVSGSQDALGICLPGISRLEYDGGFWPTLIESLADSETCTWLEQRIRLIRLGPRSEGFDPYAGADITDRKVSFLAAAACEAWSAIIHTHADWLGQAFTDCLKAQVAMFPAMMTDAIRAEIEKYKRVAYGWKLTGCGAGGFLVLVTDPDYAEGHRIRVRR